MNILKMNKGKQELRKPNASNTNDAFILDQCETQTSFQMASRSSGAAGSVFLLIPKRENTCIIDLSTVQRKH